MTLSSRPAGHAVDGEHLPADPAVKAFAILWRAAARRVRKSRKLAALPSAPDGMNYVLRLPTASANAPVETSCSATNVADEKPIRHYVAAVVPPQHHLLRRNNKVRHGLQMKVVFSRKGFDQQYGGMASPILPDGRLIPLPIPSDHDRTMIDNVGFPDLDLDTMLRNLS